MTESMLTMKSHDEQSYQNMNQVPGARLEGLRRFAQKVLRCLMAQRTSVGGSPSRKATWASPWIVTYCRRCSSWPSQPESESESTPCCQASICSDTSLPCSTTAVIEHSVPSIIWYSICITNKVGLRHSIYSPWLLAFCSGHLVVLVHRLE